MNNQWPKPRSLKDDPPPDNSTVLLFDGQQWVKSISMRQYNLTNYRANGYTHWLPMPPDPPKLKETWEEAFGEAELPLCDPRTSFKAGWNAALDKVCTFRGFNLNSEQYVLWEQFLNKIKAP